jgi:hypothetical protein
VSYDLAVWEGDRPRNDADAVEIYQALVSKWLEGTGLDPEVNDPTPRPSILRYVDALLARWPDITTDEGADSPWASGPLAQEAIGPLFYFPMRPSMADEASAFAAAKAEEFGLVCFDPQLERLRPERDDVAVISSPSAPAPGEGNKGSWLRRFLGK